ncbi:hypothetical protein A2Z67_02845 [Candidatus Woesebacteria bacterium RBG_13_36_22]|uniref:S-adenosylmethionine decarboxylase proenzyme n=1 Tax=Candidatus Woesebacteria bacterium RBG_13_36_22 TaxID=1802478 RepID=A0A1F7X853_9BACT|nr:MAG: hypothetical protein A2Z67_02845 [Candidatus Woesebacteria bacterium RBG_13_36_22]
MEKPFGYELLVDLYACASDIGSIDLVYRFLEEALVVLGSTAQAPPYVFKSPIEKFPDKAGISAWLPLIESGIQVHTLLCKSFVSIDYYTCGTIDFKIESNLILLAKRYFKPKVMESQLILRGKSYYGTEDA